VRYTGKTSWCKTFYRWLATLNFGESGAQIAFTEYWQAVSVAAERVARGSITKTGNAHARRLLTEAAWNYRFQPRIGYRAQRRAEDLPQAIRDVAWKAQLRLTGRFAKLRARGVQINKVCVAVARELAGFVWAIATAQAKLPQH